MRRVYKQTGASVTVSQDHRGHVQFEDVHFSFARRSVFDGLSCDFPRGQISAVMGASGSGKSTLLRLIGGLVTPDRGLIRVGGQDMGPLSESTLLRIRQEIGMLFQSGALLDSMTVFENVALPLREHAGLAEDDLRDRVHSRLEAVGLFDIDDLLPGELSGGMLRRAAFARSIVMEPRILLCDEPFSGLDPPNVVRIEELLTKLNRDLGLTVIATSHHMATSLRMASQIVLLQEGRAVSGTSAELASSPDSTITDFIGPDGAHFLSGPNPPSQGHV